MDISEVSNKMESGSKKVDRKLRTNVPVSKRFLITILWAIPTFLIIILLATPKTIWGPGIAGSLIFSIFAGVIAMLIPTRFKTVFVSISIFIVLLLAAIIGIIGLHNQQL